MNRKANRKAVNPGLEILALSLLLLLLFHPVAPVAHSQTGEGGATGEKIHVVSDRLVSRQAEQLVEFSGNVQATHGNTVISADVLTIYLKESGGVPASDEGNEDAIEKLTAVGNVVIDHENRKAYSERAVYTTSDGLLVLSGENVVIKEDGNSITGQEIVLHRHTGEIIVTGGEGRVEAIFGQNPGSGIRE